SAPQPPPQPQALAAPATAYGRIDVEGEAVTAGGRPPGYQGRKRFVLTDRKAWQALERRYAEISGRHLRDLFAADPGRGERLTAEAAGIYLDYSKNRVTDETMRLLIELASESGVPERRDAMFRG